MKQFLFFLIALSVGVLAGHFEARAATLYVDVASGRDTHDGRRAGQALQTLQKACDVVQPGDTVVVAPGVYFEHVQLKTSGRREAPIVFKAQGVAKNRVVISGALPAVRRGETKWQLDDAKLQLYSIALPYKPARVLYDGVDLLPYPALEGLKTFRLPGNYPGTFHGFAHDGATQRLYVRLHASGRYGSTDPNQHTMCVSPERGIGHNGNQIGSPQHSNFGIISGRPNFVTLDGFTFETPGVTGVLVKGREVTIRNCWFVGCKTGVSGPREPRQPGDATYDPAKAADAVTIEFCDFSAFPAFDDMVEVIEKYRDDPFRGDKKALHQRLYWWQRKGDGPSGGITSAANYETGFTNMAGADWIVRHNFIHDALDGLSAWSLRSSTNMQIYNNVFARLIDNAVESEDHAVNLQIHDNHIVDVFEPFSWQPLGGAPLPGPIYIYRNVVWNTPATHGLWKNAGWTPGVFKLGAADHNWEKNAMKGAPKDKATAAGEGFWVWNNSIYAPGSRFLTRVQPNARRFENFHFLNNIIVADRLELDADWNASGLNFHSNIGVWSEEKTPIPGQIFAGDSGASLANVAAIGWSNFAAGHPNLRADSPARGKAIEVAATVARAMPKMPDIGAVAFGQTWQPPRVGPQSDTADAPTR